MFHMGQKLRGFLAGLHIRTVLNALLQKKYQPYQNVSMIFSRDWMGVLRGYIPIHTMLLSGNNSGYILTKYVILTWQVSTKLLALARQVHRYRILINIFSLTLNQKKAVLSTFHSRHIWMLKLNISAWQSMLCKNQHSQ